MINERNNINSNIEKIKKQIQEWVQDKENIEKTLESTKKEITILEEQIQIYT